MKHARDDYQERIQDSANIIPEDEPVFILRGQDPAAPDTLRVYAALSDAHGCDQEVIDATKRQADLMEKWQADMNYVHAADIPK